MSIRCERSVLRDTDQIVDVINNRDYAWKDDASVDDVHCHHDPRNGIGGILMAQRLADVDANQHVSRQLTLISSDLICRYIVSRPLRHSFGSHDTYI